MVMKPGKQRQFKDHHKLINTRTIETSHFRSAGFLFDTYYTKQVVFGSKITV